MRAGSELSLHAEGPGPGTRKPQQCQKGRLRDWGSGCIPGSSRTRTEYSLCASHKCVRSPCGPACVCVTYVICVGLGCTVEKATCVLPPCNVRLGSPWGRWQGPACPQALAQMALGRNREGSQHWGEGEFHSWQLSCDTCVFRNGFTRLCWGSGRRALHSESE